MEGGVAKTEVPLEDSVGLQNAPGNRRWARRPVSDKARVQRPSWDFFWSSSSSSEDGGFGTREDCDPGILEEDSDVTTASSASEEGDERDEGHHMVGDDDDEAMKNLSRVKADRIEVFQARTYDRMIVGTVRRHAVPHCGPPVHLSSFGKCMNVLRETAESCSCYACARTGFFYPLLMPFSQVLSRRVLLSDRRSPRCSRGWTP